MGHQEPPGGPQGPSGTTGGHQEDPHGPAGATGGHQKPPGHRHRAQFEAHEANRGEEEDMKDREEMFTETGRGGEGEGEWREETRI